MEWGYFFGLVAFVAICYGVYKYVYLPNEARDKGVGPIVPKEKEGSEKND